jgi:hypothetical protein
VVSLIGWYHCSLFKAKDSGQEEARFLVHVSLFNPKCGRLKVIKKDSIMLLCK